MPNFLGPIEQPLTELLKLMTVAFGSYGIAIIIFTILVRGVLAPLNLRQLRSAKKMSALGPQIKQIQQQYKGDRERITRETMALYKEEGVNPAAGCLPLLIQMPVLYALFFIFRNLASTPHLGATAIYHDKFLWFYLDKPDSLFGHFFLGADSFWGPLPIMAAVLQWVQSRMMMQPTSDPQQRSTQQIMQFLPLFILLFAVRYPAGLALYWVTSTAFSIVMQYFITGWGQLFKSPFKVPEAAAPPPPPRVKASPARGNGTVQEAKTPPSTRVSSSADEGKKNGVEDGDRARPGKMQRAAMRPPNKGSVRPRASKGAKR